MSAPVTVEAIRSRAQRLFEREARTWAATGDHSAAMDLPLHPPTERDALANLSAARDWVASWRSAEADMPIDVSWRTRDWPRVGSQDVPDRAVVRGASHIARVAGASPEWTRLSERFDALRWRAESPTDIVAVLRSHSRLIASLEDPDFQRLLAVLGWLRANPDSGMRVRELPIRGIHTKWIEARRGLVESLHRATTGASGLGLSSPSPLVRVRFLDRSLAPVGLGDITAPVEDLARLPLGPERVFVFENLATVLAMPPVPGAVVVDGGGQRVELVARLPWAQQVTYWGDLDSHGFAILHRLRSRGVNATSALMDTDTLLAHRDLWGEDPEPNTGVLNLLTPREQDALRLLSSSGNVRLEQERIPWGYAVEALQIS